MDKELSDHLMNLQASVARVDERTIVILNHQKEHVENFINHEAEDRVDFKEVHTRITSVERKQNWMLGVGTAGIFVVTIVAGFFKGLFGG